MCSNGNFLLYDYNYPATWVLGRVEYHTYFETQVYDYQFIDQVYYYHAPTCSL